MSVTPELPKRVTLRLNESMALHSPWRVGGVVSAWIVVHHEDDLLLTLSACKKAGVKHKMWGAGTRTLVRSGGLAGALIHLGTEFARVEPIANGLKVGASAPMPVLLSMARRLGLSGLEAEVGAIGSAGAWLLFEGARLADRIFDVRYVHRGAVRCGSISDVSAQQRLVVGFSVRLDRSDPTSVRRAERRVRRLGPSGWFARPKGRRSLRSLLLKAGVGGVRLRSVRLARQEPEVFVNLGGASVEDFSLLQRSVVERVKVRTGVELSWQVRWLGKRSV